MKRVVYSYYGFQIFFPLLLWVPIFYEYQRQMGLGDPEIFGIQTLYYVIFCFLELPTGYVADRFGYRQSLRLAAGSLFLSNLIPIFFTGYFGFLSHFVLIALARALVSGASSAYLYEYLKVHDSSQRYKQIEGKARSFGLLAKVLGWAGIGYAMSWNPAIPYWLTAGAGLAAFMFAQRLPLLAVEQAMKGVQTTQRRLSLFHFLRGVRDNMVPVLTYLIGRPYLMMIMLQGVGIFVMARICQVNLYQPVLGVKGIELASYGWILSTMTIFEAFASSRPHWLRKRLSDLSAIFFLTVCIAGSFFVIAVSGKIGSVVGFILFSTAAGLAFPIQKQLLNDAITESRYRATLLSIESIIDRAVCAIVAPILGIFVAQQKIELFLVLSAVLVVLGVGIIYLILRNSKRVHETMPAVARQRER